MVCIIRTYCKYHYLEGHEFETPESELLEFLNLMQYDDFKWNQQYEITENTTRNTSK